MALPAREGGGSQRRRREPARGETVRQEGEDGNRVSVQPRVARTVNKMRPRPNDLANEARGFDDDGDGEGGKAELGPLPRQHLPRYSIRLSIHSPRAQAFYPPHSAAVKGERGLINEAGADDGTRKDGEDSFWRAKNARLTA